jgi:hypothetical protein
MHLRLLTITSLIAGIGLGTGPSRAPSSLGKAISPVQVCELAIGQLLANAPTPRPSQL